MSTWPRPRVEELLPNDPAASTRPDLQLAFSDAYRELAAGVPRHELLRTLCRVLAEDLDLPMSLLDSLHAVPAPMAASAEHRLWAELMHVVDDCAHVEMQRAMAAAYAEAGLSVFVADARGRIVVALRN